MGQLVLIRHGESTWNRDNRFTGWIDVGLTENGMEEARQAGRLLGEAGYTFDIGFTSVLTRAIITHQIVLEQLELAWLPVERSWRLNERHYGSLQGLNKGETTARYGAEQVNLWRRSYSVRPPPLSHDDPSHPRFERRYAALAPDLLPATESLEDVLNRMLPGWHDRVVPALREGKRVVVSAHGNSLRALVKHLDGVSDQEIPGLNIPTGIPLVYRLGQDLEAIEHFYLGDPETAQRKAEEVAHQAAPPR